MEMLVEYRFNELATFAVGTVMWWGFIRITVANIMSGSRTNGRKDSK